MKTGTEKEGYGNELGRKEASTRKVGKKMAGKGKWGSRKGSLKSLTMEVKGYSVEGKFYCNQLGKPVRDLRSEKNLQGVFDRNVK